MRQKKVKALRKKLNLKLPIEPDYRVAKEVSKIVYFRDALGNPVAKNVKRKVIINASKYQYRKIKKIFGGMR